MGQLTPFPLQEFDDNGTVLSGGKLYTYEAGTSTPKETYADADETTPNANPVVLDSSGRGTIFLGQGSYKLVLKNSSDEIIWQVDDIYISGAGLGTVSVVDTIADLRALAAGAYDAVLVLGYNARNDRGGGWFGWNASSSATDDYGVYIQPDSSPASGRWVRKYQRLDVRYFGAYGDGVENDTAAFGYADDYANSVGAASYVSEGNYLLSTNPGLVAPIEFAVDGKLTWSGFQPALTPIIQSDDVSQHFACVEADAPVLTELQMVRPEWFGATADGTTDDSVAIATCIASIPDQNGIRIEFQAGETYAVAVADGFALTSRSGLIFKGNAAFLKKTTNAGPLLTVEACTHIQIEALRLDGNSLATFALDFQEYTGNCNETIIVNDMYISNSEVGIRFGDYTNGGGEAGTVAIVDSEFNSVEIEDCTVSLRSDAPEIDNVQFNNLRINCDTVSDYIQILYGHIRINGLVMSGTTTDRTAGNAIKIHNGSLQIDGARINYTGTKTIIQMVGVTGAYTTAYPQDTRGSLINDLHVTAPGSAACTGVSALGNHILQSASCRALTVTNSEFLVNDGDTASRPLRRHSSAGAYVSISNKYCVNAATDVEFYSSTSGTSNVGYLKSKNDVACYWNSHYLVEYQLPDKLIRAMTSDANQIELHNTASYPNAGQFAAWYDYDGSGVRIMQGRLGYRSSNDGATDPIYQLNITSSDSTALTIDKNLRTTLYGRLDQTAATKVAAGTFTMPEANMALITGTTQINSIATTGWTPGSLINLRFDSTTVVSGTGNIRLDQSASDMTMLPGWTKGLVYDGTCWLTPGPGRSLGRYSDATCVAVTADYTCLVPPAWGNYLICDETRTIHGICSHGWTLGSELILTYNAATLVDAQSGLPAGYDMIELDNALFGGAPSPPATSRFVLIEQNHIKAWAEFSRLD